MSNRIIVCENEQEILTKEVPGLSATFQGDGNLIKIGKNAKLQNMSCHISGDNNEILIGNNAEIRSMTVMMIFPCENRKLHIGENFFCVDASFYMNHKDNRVTIGNNCFFSADVTFNTVDGHPIYRLIDGKMINKGGNITIGNHVWLDYGCSILKTVELTDDIIVDANSLVTKSFYERNIVIAGVPAKKIKENVGFSSLTIPRYEQTFLRNREGL